jgi:recombination protein RecA
VPSKKTKPAPSGAGSSSTVSKASQLASRLRKTSSKANVHVLAESGTFVTRPKFLSTQHVWLDHVLGGGIPAGRLTELYSKQEGEGKSSLAAHIMAEMIRRDGLVVLIDSERGFTEERLQTFGIDLDKVVYIEPRYVEEVFDTITEILEEVESEGISDRTLIVWDSVAATPSKTQFEAEYDERTMAAQARALSAGLGKIMETLSKHECYILALNQTRQNIKVIFGDNTQTVGGKGLKFYASTRIELSKSGGNIKNGDEILGFGIKALAVKNRMARPYNPAFMNFFFEKGVDTFKGLFDFLEVIDIVHKKGAWYTIDGYTKPDGSLKSFQQKEFAAVLADLDSKSEEKIVKALLDKRVTLPAIQRFFPNATE